MTTKTEREIGKFIETWGATGPGTVAGWVVCSLMENMETGDVRVARSKPRYLVEPDSADMFTIFRIASRQLGAPQR